MSGVPISEVISKMGLSQFTHLDTSERKINSNEVNRPALELTGYFEYFAKERVQVIGIMENSYLEQMDKAEKVERYKQILAYDVPCIIFCRNFHPDEELVKLAQEAGVPLLGTPRKTSSFLSELIFFLGKQLAKTISLHGVLVDVYGEGILIMGESGIGKSEAALELIRRGHRLVTDDVVEISSVNDSMLVGTSPVITKHFIELRGIGIIDVKSLFGVECVKDKQEIDFVIKLEEWTKNKEYDRLGLEDEYMDILGQKLPCHSIPIRPGRNIAVICEAAAVNHRQKKMGYNAAHELYRRVQENMGIRK